MHFCHSYVNMYALNIKTIVTGHIWTLYLRMDQVKLAEDSLLGILLGPFVNTYELDIPGEN